MYEDMLTTKEAARYLGYAPRTLVQHRYRGRGAPYLRINGRTIRYSRSALDKWIESGR